VAHAKLAEAVELQGEPIRAQMIEQVVSKLPITVLITCSASFLVGKDKAV
jgi:hypothetical protein